MTRRRRKEAEELPLFDTPAGKELGSRPQHHTQSAQIARQRKHLVIPYESTEELLLYLQRNWDRLPERNRNELLEYLGLSRRLGEGSVRNQLEGHLADEGFIGPRVEMEITNVMREQQRQLLSREIARRRLTFVRHLVEHADTIPVELLPGFLEAGGLLARSDLRREYNRTSYALEDGEVRPTRTREEFLDDRRDEYRELAQRALAATGDTSEQGSACSAVRESLSQEFTKLLQGQSAADRKQEGGFRERIRWILQFIPAGRGVHGADARAYALLNDMNSLPLPDLYDRLRAFPWEDVRWQQQDDYHVAFLRACNILNEES